MLALMAGASVVGIAALADYLAGRAHMREEIEGPPALAAYRDEHADIDDELSARKLERGLAGARWLLNRCVCARSWAGADDPEDHEAWGHVNEGMHELKRRRPNDR